MLSQRNNLLHLRDGVPKDANVDGLIIDKAGHVKNKKQRSSRKQLLEASSSDKSSLHSSNSSSHLKDSLEIESSFELHPFLKDINRLHMLSSDSDENQPQSPSPGLNGSHDETHHYRKKNEKNDMVAALRKRITEDLKARELKTTFEIEMKEDSSRTHLNEPEDDNDEDIFVHAKDLEANWIASRVKKHTPENPKEWESQLKERLEHEILTKELKAATEHDSHAENETSLRSNVENKNNWTTISVGEKTLDDIVHNTPRIFSDPINKVKRFALPPEPTQDKLHSKETQNNDAWSSPSQSEDCLPSDLLHMMDHSSHSRMPVHQRIPMEEMNLNHIKSIPEEEILSLSPSESVSSIDVKLHDEAEEIYQMRHMSFENTIDESNDNDNTFEYTDFRDKTNVNDEGEHIVRRPLSPDSIISLDDFVKPPIDNSNIDRDALLFHQMQMARAQAHAGSNASLDTVQSAPIHATFRDLVADVRASSHSIEVLVNIGVEKQDHLQQKLSLDDVGSTSTLIGSQVKLPSSLKDVTFPRTKKRSLRSGKESSGRFRSKAKSSVERKGNVNDNNNNVEDNIQDDDDSEKDTLVGDHSDIANLNDLLDESCNDENQLLRVSYPHPGEEEDEDPADDNDGNTSDDSIGNVSLEDGYDAFEFPTQNKRVTLSMNNILQSDYMDIDLIKSKDQTKASRDDVVNKANSVIENNGNNDDDDVDVKLSDEEIDDYEDIDADFSKSIGSQNKDSDDHYADDIDPYEIVQCETIEDIKNENKKVEKNNENVPTEQDIDALYAKVNKIKLKKLLAEGNGDEEYFLNFIPEFTSDSNRKSSNHSRNNSGKNLDAHPKPLFKSNGRNVLHSYSSVDSSDEEREIFITSTDITIPTINAKQIQKSDSNPIEEIKASMFSPLSSTHSPRPELVHPTTTTTTTVTEEVPDLPIKSVNKLTNQHSFEVQSNQSNQLPQRSSSSFKPASHSTNINRAAYSASQTKPPIPPKTYQTSNSNPPISPRHSLKNHPPPKPPTVHTNTSTTTHHHQHQQPSIPLKSHSQPTPAHNALSPRNSHTTKIDEPLPPSHKPPVPLPRSRNSNQNSPQNSQTISPHRHGSPQPSIASVAAATAALVRGNPQITPQRSNTLPMDMQPAARQLPTQKSIIITYL